MKLFLVVYVDVDGGVERRQRVLASNADDARGQFMKFMYSVRGTANFRVVSVVAEN